MSNTRAKLSKRQIKQRRKLLTADGYQAIIAGVRQAHGITLTKRTVDAYLRGERVYNTGRRRKDSYGIIPLFKVVTDAEKKKRDQKAKELSKKLIA